jgi:hypothetical protein
MLLLAVLLSAVPADSLGARGQVVPFGGVGLGFSSNNSQTQTSISLSPGALYFIGEQVAVGGRVLFGWRSAGSGTFSVPATTTVGIAPEVGAVFPLADPRIAIFPQLDLSYANSWAGGGSSHGTSLNVFAPVIFEPAAHIFLGFGPSFGVALEGSGSGNWGLGLSSQIGGWF